MQKGSKLVSTQLRDGKHSNKSYNMRKILKRCNYTSDELAEELGIPYVVICDIFSGEEKPEMELIETVSAYLGLDRKFFLMPWADVEEEFYRLPMFLYRLDEDAEWYRFKPKNKKDPEYHMAKDYFPKQDYIQEKMEFYESAVRRYIGVIEDTKVPLKYSDKELQYRRGRIYLNICTDLYKACFQLDPKEKMDYFEATKRILKNLTEILKGRSADNRLETALEMLVDAMRDDFTEDKDVDLDSLLLSGQTKCVMRTSDKE